MAFNHSLVSVIIPVYNEKEHIAELVSLVQKVPLNKEIVLVDDASTDGTAVVIKNEVLPKYNNLKLIQHDRNKGKGSAIRTGLRHITGGMVVIQDADLEYDPQDYLGLLEAFGDPAVQVVYGSRFLNNRKATHFWHYAVNWFLTFLTNVFYGSQLTDMETCYKMFRSGVICSLPLKSERFEIEPEITIRLLKRKVKIVEVPISYRGRSYHEGKKITWKDGLKALQVIASGLFWKCE